MDARALQAALGHLGLRLPYGLLPGSYPGGLVAVAADAEAWDAYGWNPPQYMRAGAACRIGPWQGLRPVPRPRSASAVYNEFAYRNADVPPALPEPTGAAALPPGWQALPESFPAWSCARFVYRVPPARALAKPDPEAALKPTWSALVAALAGARLGTLPDALIRRANAQAKARIAVAYVGVPDRIEELTRRANGRTTAAQDAERTRLVAVCHGLEARIRAAGTIAALEQIDVASDGVWTPPQSGGESDGDEA